MFHVNYNIDCLYNNNGNKHVHDEDVSMNVKHIRVNLKVINNKYK